MRKIFALTGFARSGKDSLFKGFEDAYESVGVECVRVAFADCLKSDIDPFLTEHMSISAWTENAEEKNIIRPFLVEYGRGKRKLDSLAWVKKVINKIDIDDEKAYIITDARYLNEVEALADRFGEGGVISVYINNEDVGAANDEESNSIKEIIDSGTLDTMVTWSNMDKEELKIESTKQASKILWENGEL